MKKITAALTAALMILISFAFPGERAFAERSIIGGFGVGGNWSREEQGMRFSVYDFEMCRTVSTFDTFSRECYNYNRNTNDEVAFSDFCSGKRVTPYMMLLSKYNHNPVLYATGCKFDYLYAYENEYNFDITSLAKDFVESIPKTAHEAIADPNYHAVRAGDIGEEYDSIFTPIKSESISNKPIGDAVNKYLPNEAISSELRSQDSSLIETILAVLGFYVNEDVQENYGTLEYFDTQRYVLVIEPIYWVSYPYYRSDQRYGPSDETYYFFYGTATEWALYGEYMKNQVVYNKLSVHSPNKDDGHGVIEVDGGEKGYGAYRWEYSLECLALPLSCLNHNKQDKNLGNSGLTLSTVNVDRFWDIQPKEASELTPAKTTEISEFILQYLGYDVLFANEIEDLTVDFAVPNVEFHPNTEVVLSFYVKQVADLAKKYCPDIDTIDEEGSYGIRLNIHTLNTGDIKISDFTAAGLDYTCTILCDGLPDYDEDGDGLIYNLAYDTFKLPDKTGVWQFEMTVDVITAEGLGSHELYVRRDGYKSISSNSGKAYRSMGYINFEINVVDPTAGMLTPGNTSANDVLPEGFAVPDPYEFIAAHNVPVTERSWKYYSAYKQRGADGSYTVGFNEDNKQTGSFTRPVYIMESPIPSAELVDGVLITGSGYGIGASAEIQDNNCKALRCSLVQNMVMLFPEYNYNTYIGRFDRTDTGSRTEFSLEKNPYSIYCNDIANEQKSRVHFTPLWYPDGKYNVIVYYYDSWTPVGPIGDVAVYTVKLSGTVYDDWYITRR